MTRTIHCGSCGGSGFRAGTYGDIECIDCAGEGSWETEDEETISSVTLADCRRLYGCLEAPPLDQLTEVHPDPLKHRRAA